MERVRVIAVYTDNIGSPEAREAVIAVIAQIARSAYDYMIYTD